ncbi:hypothetical protein V3O24_11005 [Methylobacter sp. Wu8]
MKRNYQTDASCPPVNDQDFIGRIACHKAGHAVFTTNKKILKAIERLDGYLFKINTAKPWRISAA